MSPEQAGGMAVDQRSDIYSLGAIMYELFAGQPLFRGRSFGEYVRKHLTENPVPPRQTQGGSNTDPQLEALIMRCLAKEPNARFGHILELRDGLLHLLGGAETHPGAMSGVHPPSGLNRQQSLPHSAQLHALPLPAPSHTTLPTPHPHHSSGASQVSYAPQPGYSYVEPRPARAASMAWPWVLGGALAVGLGITAALFYVEHRGTTEVATPATTPAPVVVPVVTPQPAPTRAKPQQLELRFDSLPSAGVYAEGHSAELCRTPCAFNVDLADGGATDQRSFVVRSAGYLDKTITVDLTGVQREFLVTLERDGAQPVVEKKHVVTAKKKPGTTKKPDVVEDKPPLQHDDSLEKIDHKNDPAIDATDTHDPFKHTK